MSCDCRPSTDLCDSCVELLGTGAGLERARIIALLKEHLVNLRTADLEHILMLIKGGYDA